jgi:cystathionine gamma-synthase
LNHAASCEAAIIDQAPEAREGAFVRAADFLLDDSAMKDPILTAGSQTSNNTPRRFYIVFYPAEVNAAAMGFWRLSGTGISSRLAQSMLKHLDNIYSVSGGALLSTDTSLSRPLTNLQSDDMIRSRIVKLLQRGSVSAAQSAKFRPSDVFLYPTGMAAIYGTNSLLQSWQASQTVVFGFPYELTLKLVEKYGVNAKFYGFGTPTELDEFESYLAAELREGRTIQSVWCECASNPLLRTVDLERIRRLADMYGFVVVVDETIGSFANVDLAGVADIIVTSLTKSFSGRANVMGGSVVLNPSSPWYAPLKNSLEKTYVNELFGADSHVMEYNSRGFLSVAATMNRNAQHLVSLLNPIAGTSFSTLSRVYYPSTCWSRTNYEALMRKATPEFAAGYGGLFTLEFDTVEAASVFFDTLNVHKGPSLGAHVTLAQPYVQTVFSREKEWAASYGLKESIVRISVGLEDEYALGQEFIRALHVVDRLMPRSESDDSS